jgi:hypothetical protein
VNDEINAYVEGVRAALSGISEATREELLEDLPEHLAEVQAEGIGTLVERLGTPSAYASELLATAGLVGDFPTPPSPRFPALHEAREQAAQVLTRADDRIGPLIGYPKASEFLVLLRPAWWVLRGYLAAMAIAYLIRASGSNRLGLLPRVGDSGLVAAVLLAGCVILSIALATRSTALDRLPRWALRSGTVVLIVFALAGFASADNSARDPGYTDANYGYSDPNPYSNVNDVYVYDNQGRLVTGAHLYDQDGSPIQLGRNYCTDPDSGEDVRSRNIGYPFCPQNAPFSSPSPSVSASPSAHAPSPTASFLTR